MATVNLNQMRVELSSYYTKRGWNYKRVGWMPDNQIQAIYLRYSNQNWPVPSSPSVEKVKQTSMFDK